MFRLYLKGKSGESYNVGSKDNYKNINLVKEILKTCKQQKINISSKTKISFVKDRPGHDFRYALDCKKIYRKLKWKPKIKMKNGLFSTIKWYFDNKEFLKKTSSKKFTKRLGLNL